MALVAIWLNPKNDFYNLNQNQMITVRSIVEYDLEKFDKILYHYVNKGAVNSVIIQHGEEHYRDSQGVVQTKPVHYATLFINENPQLKMM